ncbi:MAG TPA: hypothetical protein VHE12_14605 [bacterium]|nr:hypothetical protein [bacterium]
MKRHLSTLKPFLAFLSWMLVLSFFSRLGAEPTPTPDLTVSPDEEIRILDAVVGTSKTPTAVPNASTTSEAQGNGRPAVLPARPPLAPTGLKVEVLPDGVHLTWDKASASSPVSFYTVYRSLLPGFGYKALNPSPVLLNSFLDGETESPTPPKNGNDYFYVVAATDALGRQGPMSDEVNASAAGLAFAAGTSAPVTLGAEEGEEEKTLTIPERNLVNLQLPADTQLSIQGYKKIDAQFSFQHFNRDVVNGIPNEVDTTLINQELVVQLQGKVGKNVDVNVDYSDVNRAGGVDTSKQDISIKYHGDEDSPVQEVAFGDLQLLLPNTEFAGFSKQLFGLQTKLKFDQFRFTGFFAQTKGIAETKVFKGNSLQVDKVIPDITYIPLRYFLITRAYTAYVDPTTGQTVNGALPAPNSEQIWVNSGIGTINPIGPNFGGPNNAYEHWLPGRDYTIDYNTGVITFTRALSFSAQIAVGYTSRTGQVIALTGSGASQTLDFTSGLKVPDDGNISNAAHMIKDNNNGTGISSPNAIAMSPLYLPNYYDLGRDKIVPPDQDPDFLFQVISQGSNNILQTGQGVSQVGAANPWVYNVDLDLNVLTVLNANFITALAPSAPSSFLWPERPFANLDLFGGANSAANPSDVYSQTVPPTSLYSLHIRYKTQLNFFQLGRFNIIRGSESVYLDGRRLRRDVDYFFDYTSGFLDFPDKSILRPDSQVVVSYEYSPFGAFNQNNIIGARAEYDLTDHFFLGSTFLESDAQQPQDVPQIGSTPNSLSLFDADARYDMTPDELQSIFGIIPGLENWKPPFSLKLSAEVAQSYFNPDTYNAEGEQGVALIDNMEGIDNATNASTNSTSWLVSSPPQAVGFLGSVQYGAGSNASNNRIRFYNNGAPNSHSVIFQTIGQKDNSGQSFGDVPGYGGHVYATTNNPNDFVSVLQFPYSGLTNQRWGGLRQVLSVNGTDLSNAAFLQAWVYNDGNPKWIMIDFGIVSENTNGNLTSVPNADPNLGTSKTASVTFGIPSFYYSNPAVTVITQPGETTTQEGVSIGTGTNYVTQDMNADNVLESSDNYYEYGIQANWSGWKQIKIPINYSAAPGMQSTADFNYFFNTVGLPNPSIIRAIRFWMAGATASPASGDVYVENLGFAHNLWQLQVDPTANVNQGVTVNTSKFDVTSISQDQDKSYVPTLRFVNIQAGQDSSAIEFKEKALKLTYNLSSTDMEPPGDLSGLPIYYASRTYSQGLDLTDFEELHFDLQIRSYQPGEVLFVRLGNDQQNYFQYNVQLNEASKSSLYSWGSVGFPLDGSQGNRKQVGNPFLNRITQISFGVISPNGPNSNIGTLWINNLRGVRANVRAGVARRANAALTLGDNFATVNARYREVDSGFTQIDQTTTHFQHSRQVGMDYASSGVSVFSQPIVQQFSVTRQDLFTEEALANNPYFLTLPNSRIDTATGSLSYSKDLGPGWGRITTFRLSGSSNLEDDIYQPYYLSQPGVLGNVHKGQLIGTANATYDAPPDLFFIPWGANQFTGSYSITKDTQTFDNPIYAPYERHTRTQTYGWTNTTELVKNLVFTPGFTYSLTDAVGNTNAPGVPVSLASAVPQFTNFQERYQPKAGLVYRGIPGAIPSVDYSGSNQYDYVSFSDGRRFNNANNLNYSLNLTPGTWWDPFQKMNLTIFAGRTESGTASIPAFNRQRTLTFEEQWLTTPAFDIALNGTRSVAHQLNGSFRLFDVWDFRPTGTWTDQLSLLAQGTNPVKQVGDTYGLTTVYNRKIATIPYIEFSLDSAQLQYTHSDSTQYDSSLPPDKVTSANISNQTQSETYGLTLPYDIDQKAQGNIRFQRTTGTQFGLSTTNTLTTQLEDQGSIEYTQKFAPNLEIHVPFTHWKLKLQDAIEFRATLLMDFVNNQSAYVYNQRQTQRYRGTIDLNYNALKNLRVGIGLVNEYFYDTTYQLSNSTPDHTKDYSLWQGTISAEARF